MALSSSSPIMMPRARDRSDGRRRFRVALEITAPPDPCARPCQPGRGRGVGRLLQDARCSRASGPRASAQSRPLESRAALVVEAARQRIQSWDEPFPLTAVLGGYRIVPTQIEFWADGAFRLHDRFVWTRAVQAAENQQVTDASRQIMQVCGT